MKLSAVLALFAALFALALSHAPEDSVPGVKDLDSKNFDSIVGKNANVLVEFYAPWCGHCKRLADDYAKLGEIVSSSKSKDDFIIAKVNADKHKDVGERFGVRGFPTIKFFPKGSLEPEEYNGGRSTDDFVDFLNRKGARVRVSVAPSDVITLTPSNFDAVVKNTETARLVEFYAPWCGHCKQLAPTYEKLGTVFATEKGVVIAKLDADAHRDLSQQYGITGFPTLKFFPKGSTEPEEYSSGRDLQSFVSFINEKAGTSRDENGKLMATAGRIAALDEIAKGFASASNKDELLAKAKEAVSANPAATYYVRVMEKIVEKGSGYAAKEKARLEGIIKRGATARDKTDDLQTRVNILGAF